MKEDKNEPIFKEIYKLHAREFLGLSKRIFQVIFYMNTNIYGDFQIYISVPLKQNIFHHLPCFHLVLSQSLSMCVAITETNTWN